ncbi:MAG TPA: hypothetical protein VH642_02515, partial [Streptosporangiaceae bacterium]
MPEAPQAPAAQPPEPGKACPQCGAVRSGRFCESCGFDFDAGAAPAATGAGRAAPGDPAPPPGGAARPSRNPAPSS